MPGWADWRKLIQDELTQKREEGCDTSEFIELADSIQANTELEKLYLRIHNLPIRPDFPYVEPSDFESICACRNGEQKRWTIRLDDGLLDRIKGGWLGRIAGCMLGLPVEGWTREQLGRYLKGMGEYPLRDYVPTPQDKLPEGVDRPPDRWATRGAWDHAMMDDDLNYTALNLKIMECKGPDFTTNDVGHMWLDNLPYHQTCTAERQAYMNLVNELPLDQVPLYANPYREWIGAQIRADFWGYCAPGWPEKAAEFAWRDASLSHVKNGVYGEMLCAAAISASLATQDLTDIIGAALSQIPKKSRLAEAVSDCIRWSQECSTWEEANDRMANTYYGRYSKVHTINNLAAILISLLYGWPDFEKVITICLMQGMDTDCTCATAGSIIGAALGAKALPDKWIKPLGESLETAVVGLGLVEIEELANRTFGQARRVLER